MKKQEKIMDFEHPVPLEGYKLSRLICEFMKKHPEARLHPQKITRILSLTVSCFRDFGTTSFFAKEVLNYIARRMFWSDFDDSESVSLLLNMQLDNENYLSLMISDADLKIRREEHHEFVAYFLHHAYRRRLLYNGSRIPCVKVFDVLSWWYPIQYAVYTLDVPLLRVLQRYGALLSHETRLWKITGHNGWFVVMLTWILRSILDLNPDLLQLKDLTHVPKDREKYQSLLSACSLLLPDLPRLSLGFLKSVYYQGRYLRLKEEAADFVRDFSTRVMPGLDQHFTIPSDLVAACRNVIRRCLNERWLLPSGIDSLPLPNRLKQYIDLEIT